MEDIEERQQSFFVGEKFDDSVARIRTDIEGTALRARRLMQHEFLLTEMLCDSAADKGEMRANVMLAYRHLEDARMRLGKAIQAFDGGASVYSK